MGKHKDLSGLKFGDLMVIKDSIKRKKNGEILWECKCICDKCTDTDNVILVTTYDLTHEKVYSCNTVKKSQLLQIEDGTIFGRWKVIKKLDEQASNGSFLWLCECQCKDKTLKKIKGTALKNGQTTCCGCKHKEKMSKEHKKQNNYDLSGEYGIGWTSNTNKEFYFDLEDYEKIKYHCWWENYYGYITSKETTGNKRKHIHLHRLVMGVTNDDDIVVDHIFGNKQDSRKLYLRLATDTQNSCNAKTPANNTSGFKGVIWHKINKKWEAYLTYEKIRYWKRFDTFEEAVEYRKYLEEKYHREYTYQEPPPEYLEKLELN